MASAKALLVLVLVAMVTLDSANCYFRLGREMEGMKLERSGAIAKVEKIVLQRVLSKLAKCVMQVC